MAVPDLVPHAGLISPRMPKLFTERHGPAKARTAEVLNDATGTGLMAMVSALMSKGWFGEAFPELCTDG